VGVRVCGGGSNLHVTEDEAHRILSQNRTVHLTLAQELAAKRELGKDEVRAIIGGRKPRRRRKVES
jgi:ATP-dependent Zn protease